MRLVPDGLHSKSLNAPRLAALIKSHKTALNVHSKCNQCSLKVQTNLSRNALKPCPKPLSHHPPCLLALSPAVSALHDIKCVLLSVRGHICVRGELRGHKVLNCFGARAQIQLYTSLCHWLNAVSGVLGPSSPHAVFKRQRRAPRIRCSVTSGHYIRRAKHVGGLGGPSTRRRRSHIPL